MADSLAMLRSGGVFFFLSKGGEVRVWSTSTPADIYSMKD